MSIPPQSPVHYGYASASDMTWSKSEKAIARQAFDAALKRELHELMQEAKEIAGKSKQPSDLWDLQEYLTQRRRRSTTNTTIGTRTSRRCLGHFCTRPSTRTHAPRAGRFLDGVEGENSLCEG
jgi:hypothetical protein